MKKTLVVLMLVFLTGCEQPRVRVFEVERVADKKAQELASVNWGKIEYAPGEYAGFAYDSSGLYGNLHGTNTPQLVAISFHRFRELPRAELFFSWVELQFIEYAYPDELLAPRHHAPEGQFKWMGTPVATGSSGSSYGRTFWISWKALGPGLPGPDGRLEVHVNCMRSTSGAKFEIDANSAK